MKEGKEERSRDESRAVTGARAGDEAGGPSSMHDAGRTLKIPVKRPAGGAKKKLNQC